MATAKPAKPEFFNGKDTSRATIVSWMFDIKQYLLLTGTPEDQRTPIAATYLQGTAKTWYITMFTKPGAETPSLDNFLAAFKKRFLSATEREDIFAALETLKQGTGTAQVYTDEFKLLTSQLEITDLSLLRMWFIRGLNPILARAVVNDLVEGDDVDEMCRKTL
jgi:hypothetical protein